MNQTGISKPLEDIDFQDFEQSPIWVFALDEEEGENQDETWVKPVMSPINVTRDMYEAYILLHTQDKHIPVFAHLDTVALTIYDIWIKNEEGIPVELKDSKESHPLILVSAVPIEAKRNIRFVVAPDNENATIHPEDKTLFQKKKWWQRLFGKKHPDGTACKNAPKDTFIKKRWEEENILFYLHFKDDFAVEQIEIHPHETILLSEEHPIKGDYFLYDQSLSDLDLCENDYITGEEFYRIWTECNS